MDETPSANGGPPPERAAHDFFVRAAPDPLLEVLITFADQGSEVGVTLHVGGSMVSGVVISGSKYYELLADLFQEGYERAGMSDAGAPMRDALMSVAKDLYSRSSEKPSNPDTEKPPMVRTFIHLRDAHFVDATGKQFYDAQRVAGLVWRGRLADISGWFLGNPSS